MIRIMDRLFLFIYSIIAGALSVFVLMAAAGWIDPQFMLMLTETLQGDIGLKTAVIISAVVFILFSLRFLYLSVRTDQGTVPSIDQRNDFGDVRISLDTIENLSLRAASKIRGVKDLKAKVNVNNAGLEIRIRAFVEGDTSIPGLSEEIQRAVKYQLEEITGVPVASVSVFIANVTQSPAFKSRVE